jgi:hypothetical protein
MSFMTFYMLLTVSEITLSAIDRTKGIKKEKHKGSFIQSESSLNPTRKVGDLRSPKLTE